MKPFFYLYLLTLNIFTTLLMFLDKRKAKRHQWRISERNLILLSLIGGSVGTLLGMNLFRHKTKHIKFKVGVPFIILIQLLLYFLFLQLQ